MDTNRIPIPPMPRLPRRGRPRVGFFHALLIGSICWPMEALLVMWGLDLLGHEGFGNPTPGYVSSFLVSVGFEMLLGAATLTRRATEHAQENL